jgi:hypothetical protein
MSKLRFARSESWNDRLGRHTRVEVFQGTKSIGWLEGETGTAIPMLRYSTNIAGFEHREWDSQKEAKQAIREHFAQANGCE